MLDVHILVLPSRDRHTVQRCINSVLEAAEQVTWPISLHLVSATEGHIGLGRAEGYSRGHHGYVTCVDDDDWVEANAFTQMRKALEAGTYDAIATPEWINRNGHVEPGKDRHHLIAFKRDVIINHRPWKCCGDIVQIRSIGADRWLDLPERAYVHNVYVSPARLMRRGELDEVRAAYG